MEEFELEDYIFEWDDEKAEINKRKHKVIGKVDNILVVIYTERKEKIRIISARRANKKEREDYYEQFSYL